MNISTHTKDKAPVHLSFGNQVANTPEPTLFMDTRKREIVSGQKNNRLTVICQSENNSRGKRMVKCKCDCGNIKNIQFSYFIDGHTQSCGCKKIEAQTTGSITHGAFGTRIYGIWAGMKNRCYNSKVKSYQWYGAKGVTVCDEWHDFEPFQKWALSNGYKDDLTIERKNPFGNYEPDNCEWIPMSMQYKNKRKNYSGMFINFNKTPF